VCSTFVSGRINARRSASSGPLNPGSIIGRGAVIYPCTNWRGILPANMIAKNKATVEVAAKRQRET